MSSFTGKIKEYPQISVDRFDGRNLASTAYFLSHAHSDHMIGLSSPQFLDHLESNSGVFLYCSPITQRFLQASIRHRPLSPYIYPLQVKETVKITVPNVAEEVSHYLWVTPIQAAHCPGSVMFLFEGRGGCVLYTGDFRISVGEAATIRALHNEDGTAKMIDSLYIDTTFCHKDVMQFPSREESSQAIGDLVEDWLMRGNNYLIHLVCPAKYGYEFLYKSLSERFGMKIHVCRWKYRMYDTVPEIQDFLTDNATMTWIHACDFRMKNEQDIERTAGRPRQLPCRCVPFRAVAEPIIRVIRPSAMFYTIYQSAKEIKQISSDGTFCRVLLSMHASCSEVLDLVSYLRPRKVFPNVIPLNSTKEEVLKLLHEALNRSGDHYSIEYGGSQRTSFGSFKRQIHSSDSNCNGGSTTSSSMLDAGLLDVYLPSASKRRRHSDSNMTLILPTPRGNMKGSLSLEGESRQHESTTDCEVDKQQPSSSKKYSLNSSQQVSQTDSEISELEWKDPYTPTPTKSKAFFQSSMDSSQDTTVHTHCAKRNLSSSLENSDLKSVDNLEGNTSFCPANKDSFKRDPSQDSVELNSVFSDDDASSVIESSDLSRVESTEEVQMESPIKRSRKMWYKHKYFSTPIHDEVDKGNKLESKPSMGPRSSSLPLPELPRENFDSADLFDSTDINCDRILPLITVSSPSASESQHSEETTESVVISSGEPSDCDQIFNEDSRKEIDNNNLVSPNNNLRGDGISSLRPSVIRTHKLDTPVNVIDIDDEVKFTNSPGKRKFNSKMRAVKFEQPGNWIDCSKMKKMKGLNNTVTNVPSSKVDKKSPELVDLIEDDSDSSPEMILKDCDDAAPSSSRTSCLKTTRRTQNQVVEVVSLDQHPL